MLISSGPAAADQWASEVLSSPAPKTNRTRTKLDVLYLSRLETDRSQSLFLDESMIPCGVYNPEALGLPWDACL